MPSVKDGYFKQIGSTKGDNEYVLLAGGGQKKLSDIEVSGYLPLTGGTLTGDLTVETDVTVEGDLEIASAVSTSSVPEQLNVADELEDAVHYRTINASSTEISGETSGGGSVGNITTNSPNYLTISNNLINANVTTLDSGNEGLASSQDVKEYVDSKIRESHQIISEDEFENTSIVENTIYFIY